MATGRLTRKTNKILERGGCHLCQCDTETMTQSTLLISHQGLLRLAHAVN